VDHLPPLVKPQVTGLAPSGARITITGPSAATPQPNKIYLLFNFSGGGVRTTNGGQVEQTLKELRRLGRLEKVDAAAVQMVRSMARALDADPSNAALWRQYREAVRELAADDGAGGSFEEAVAALSAEVRDEAEG